ncbi:DoxX family protein [Thermomonospora amylolytica]|uniref:DoxX family protein n=1 Tax=Thermomonospora amylolytica TaxID=1411117 RepID=UPI000E6C7AEC|nr:DoxX family protein [Thermomonospora amylolytica]
MRSRPLYDVVALLARLGVGIVFLAHGWQKIQVGVTATADGFARMDVPAPTAAAIYATFTELLGGLALIAGLGLPVAGTLLFLDMAGAFVFVHGGNGVFLVDQGQARGGFELVLVLGLASLLFAAGGGGRLTLDHRLFPRRAREAGEPEDSEEPWPPPAEETAPVPAAEPPVEETAPQPRSRRTRRKGKGSPEEGRDSLADPPADSAAPPRLAADIVNEDVRVAGRRKSRPPEADY